MGLVVKNLPADAGDATDMGSVSGLGRSPGEGNDNPLQYSCLGNPKDRGAWQATVHRVKKESDTTEHTHTHTQAHRQNSKMAFIILVPWLSMFLCGLNQ